MTAALLRSVCALGLLVASPNVVSAQESCTVCRDRSNVPLPDKSIQIDGIPVESCASLETTAGFLLTGTDFCDGIQNVGTLCGCPIAENACHLCQDGISRVTNLTLELSRYNPQEFIPVAPADAILTCEILEALLHSISADEARCMEIQFDAGVECGCPAPPPPDDDGVNNSGGNFSDTPTASPAPSTTMVPTSSPRKMCNLCAIGGSITRPDRNITLGDLPIETCSDLNAFSVLLTPGSFECVGIQTLGAYCGCPVPEDACTFCPDGEPVPYPDRPLDWFRTDVISFSDSLKPIGESLTCGLMESILTRPSEDLIGIKDTNVWCIGSQLRSWGCGCSPDPRAIYLTWAYRGSGMISLLCSALIIWDVIRKTKKHNMVFTTYHQLVLGISLYDCISSFSYSMVGVFVPRESGFYLSYGNYDTCQAQAFLIQFGLTSVFYNMLLALYFFLMVCRNWKEADFKKLHRWFFHVFLACLGLGLSITVLPFAGPQVGICYLLPAPFATTYLAVDLFLTTPISVALGVLTSSTLAICVKVYQQEQKAKKWVMRSKKMQLTKKVLWQSFWYVMAFCVTLPFQIVSYYYVASDYTYQLALAGAFVGPFQGAMNAMVYFQRSKIAAVVWAAVRKKACCCFSAVACVWFGKKKHNDENATKNTGGPKHQTAHHNSRGQRVTVASGVSAVSEEGSRVVKAHDDEYNENAHVGWEHTVPSPQQEVHGRTEGGEEGKGGGENRDDYNEEEMRKQEEEEQRSSLQGGDDDVDHFPTLENGEHHPPQALTTIASVQEGERSNVLPLARVRRHHVSQSVYLSGVIEHWKLNEDSEFSSDEDDDLELDWDDDFPQQDANPKSRRRGRLSLPIRILGRALPAFGRGDVEALREEPRDRSQDETQPSIVSVAAAIPEEPIRRENPSRVRRQLRRSSDGLSTMGSGSLPSIKSSETRNLNLMSEGSTPRRASCGLSNK